MRKRIYFFIRTLRDLVPAIWEATKSKNFDVGLFSCNDRESWKKYLELKSAIAKIIDPNYQLEVKKGYNSDNLETK